MGIGGPMTDPSGRIPSRIAFASCSSVQRPIPVSLSGVMFEATALKPFSSNTIPPDNPLSSKGSPFSPR